MGTRNLTCIVKDGEFKAVKYCQWDGYLSGQGQSIVTFLTEVYKPKKFAKRLGRAVELTNEEIMNRWKAVGADDSGFVSMDIASQFKVNNAHLDRDMGGGKFLQYIQETKFPEIPPSDVTFAGDSLFCEWCYVINLDTNQLEVYKGFNKIPLAEDERFFFLEEKKEKKSEYHPVKHLATFKINKKLAEKWDEWLEERESQDE